VVQAINVLLENLPTELTLQHALIGLITAAAALAGALTAYYQAKRLREERAWREQRMLWRRLQSQRGTRPESAAADD
jgi:hypothetical protein